MITFVDSRLWFPILVLLLLMGCSQSSGSRGNEGLTVDFAFTKKHIIVKNGDLFVWRDVTVTLNDKFIYKAETIPRGSYSIALELFISSSGENFPNNGSLRLRDIRINAHENRQGSIRSFTW